MEEIGNETLNETAEIYPPLPSCCTVLASNISLKATETSLREFFGICGTIKKISIETTNDGDKQIQTALIVFENDEAAKTALFLNDTFIIDSAIIVVPYNGSVSSTSNEGAQSSPTTATQEPPGMFVNALASAYMFGSKAWQSIVEYDQKHKISETINKKANEIDKNYGITDKGKAAVNKVEQVADNIDKKLGITEGTTKIATKTNEKYTQLRERNENTNKFFERLDNVGKSITNTWEDAMKRAQQKVDILREEIKKRENEAQIAKEHDNSNIVEIKMDDLKDEDKEKTLLLAETSTEDKN